MTIFSRACILVSLVFVSSSAANALDFKQVDALLTSSANYSECQTTLESFLPQAADGKEKAEVLWRLSRLYFVRGQYQSTKSGRRELFGKGVEYASEAIKADPSNPECYMWHSANVGRECQTHSMMEQAAAVPVLMDDMSAILDKLGRTDYSAAWQALAEIYYNHPFKSNDAAINFERKAAATVPSGETRISTFTLLARMLHERGWSASKRKEQMTRNSSLYSKSYKSNIEKYSYYDGSLGQSNKPVWSDKALGEMSDADEARAIAAYAESLYNRSNKTNIDKADFRELSELTDSWK